MNQSIQDKIEQFKKLATTQKVSEKSAVGKLPRTSDSLSSAIHSKRDADIFMAELKAIVKQAE
jgi:hypothetical protein